MPEKERTRVPDRGERLLGAMQRHVGQPIHLNDLMTFAGFDPANMDERRRSQQVLAGMVGRVANKVPVEGVSSPQDNWWGYQLPADLDMDWPKSPPLVTEGRPLTAGVAPVQFRAAGAPAAGTPAAPSATVAIATATAPAESSGHRRRVSEPLIKTLHANPGVVKHYTEWGTAAGFDMQLANDRSVVSTSLAKLSVTPGMKVFKPEGINGFYGYDIPLPGAKPEPEPEPEPKPEPTKVSRETPAPAAELAVPDFGAQVATGGLSLRAKLYYATGQKTKDGEIVVVNLADPTTLYVLVER